MVIALTLVEVFLRLTNFLDEYNYLPTPLGNAGLILKTSTENDRDFDWFYKLQYSELPLKEIKIQDQTLRENDNKKRVIFLGDSGTFGVGVSKNQIFTHLLAEKFKDIQFINAGVPGAIPADSLWLLKNHLLNFKPSLVIFTIFMANDINQSLVGYQDKRTSIHFALFKFSVYKLFYLSWMKLKYTLFEQASHNERALFKKKNKGELLNVLNFYEGEYSTYLKKYSKNMNLAFEGFKHVIQEMDKECKDAGAEFLVTFIPTRSYLTNKLDIQPREYYQNEHRKVQVHRMYNEIDFEKSNDLVEGFLKAAKITYINPSRLMRDQLAEKTLSTNDDHLSVEGHQTLANELLPYFKQRADTL